MVTSGSRSRSPAGEEGSVERGLDPLVKEPQMGPECVRQQPSVQESGLGVQG